MAMLKDYLHNKFKHGIDAGILQYGVAQETTSADVAEILATSNYDWLFVDGEHGPHDFEHCACSCAFRYDARCTYSASRYGYHQTVA